MTYRAMGGDGLFLDFNTNVINNSQTRKLYSDWLGQTASILHKSNLKLGLVTRPSALNEFNASIFEHADLQYVSLDAMEAIQPQLDIIASNSKIFNDDAIYEIPTVSKLINTNEFSEYTLDLEYGAAEYLIENIPLPSRSVEPVITSDDSFSYRLFDAVSAYNYLQRLNSILGPTDHALNVAVADQGHEEYTIWELLNYEIGDPRNKAVLSERVYATLRINFVGSSGEIYRLQSSAKPGKRSLTFTGNMISASTITDVSQNATVLRSGNKPKQLALTFDDGPHPKYTREVLDILDSYGVSGTFFVVGENALKYPEIVREIINRGHEIENHSFSHPLFGQLTLESQADQINATSKLLESIGGQKIQFFRKPFSDDTSIDTRSDLAYLNMLSKLGLSASEYDIDSKDWKLDTTDQIVDRVEQLISESSAYSQLLMHDTHQNPERTLEALPQIIERLQAKGIDLVRVDELDDKRSAIISTPAASFAITNRHLAYSAIIAVNIAVIVISTLKYGWLILGGLTYKVARLAPRRSVGPQKGRTSRKTLAIVVSCYNEEKVIGKTLDALLASTYRRLKIIAVNDGSTDGTLRILRRYARKDPRVRVINLKNGGKAKALQTAVDSIRNKWIVFCDADTLFAEDALEKFAATADARSNIGAVAGHIMIGNPNNTLTRSQVIEYGIAHKFIKAAQDPGNMITVVPGAAGVWNRAALNSAGGFSPVTLAEDADATMQLIRQGQKVTYQSDIVARTEAPEDIKMLYIQRTRWQLGNMQALAKHRRGFLNYKYGLLGLIGLPFFALEILSALLFPLLLGFTFANILDHSFSWETSLLPESSFSGTDQLIIMGLVLLAAEVLMSLVAILSNKRPVKQTLMLLLTLPYYLTVYKAFLSYTAIVAFTRALKGTPHGWGRLKRTASVTQAT